MLPHDTPRGRRIDIRGRLLRQPWRFLLKGRKVTRLVLLLAVGMMMAVSLPYPLDLLVGGCFLVWMAAYIPHLRRRGLR